MNFIDTETTGLDLARDRILELAIVQLRPDSSERTWCWRFNPGVDVPAHVVSLHGLSQQHLKDSPSFKEKAAEVLGILEGCDLAGYNLLNFDVPLIWEELYRSGIDWNLSGTSIVDVSTIFRSRESRNLAYALKFYCNRSHGKAHNALGDVRATIQVLEAQLNRYPDLAGKDVPALADACRVDSRVDLAGMVLRDRDGDLCYRFGGVPFDSRSQTGLKVKEDPRLAEWASSYSFPMHTKRVLQGLLPRNNRGPEEP